MGYVQKQSDTRETKSIAREFLPDIELTLRTGVGSGATKDADPESLRNEDMKARQLDITFILGVLLDSYETYFSDDDAVGSAHRSIPVVMDTALGMKI